MTRKSGGRVVYNERQNLLFSPSKFCSTVRRSDNCPLLVAIFLPHIPRRNEYDRANSTLDRMSKNRQTLPED